MANKNPLKGLPSERKAKQLEKARRKAETQARGEVERREAAGPAGARHLEKGPVPSSGTD